MVSEIKIIELSKNYGFAEGYNKGLLNIQSEYVVIINSDVLVTESWLDPIIDTMERDKSLGIVQPVIKSLEYKDHFEYAGAAGGYIDIFGYPFCRGRIFDTVEKDEGQYSNDAEIFWASGATMVCRSKLFKSLGGFDGGFFAHQEEIDFCWRLKVQAIISNASQHLPFIILVVVPWIIKTHEKIF
ncbi:MAG: glycosyltransferase family 2 protein [Saprospiraceae bacterium]|nr:glycosyltransferase family 2 protein [Saprospiraceae bacterium]